MRVGVNRLFLIPGEVVGDRRRIFVRRCWRGFRLWRRISRQVVKLGGAWIWTCDGLSVTDLARTIQLALREPEGDREERIAGGRANARFTWEACAKSTHRCFEDALGMGDCGM
jgi:hypothetical protein